MYRHLLVPIDCTEDAQHLAHGIARFASPLVPCRVTLAATITPTDNRELNSKRRRHACDALRTIGDQLLQEGIWSRSCILENKDAAKAIAAEATDTELGYDLIVMGTYQTRQEDMDAPCRGSFVDQVCAKTKLPVLVLPFLYEGWQ